MPRKSKEFAPQSQKFEFKGFVNVPIPDDVQMPEIADETVLLAEVVAALVYRGWKVGLSMTPNVGFTVSASSFSFVDHEENGYVVTAGGELLEDALLAIMWKCDKIGSKPSQWFKKPSEAKKRFW